LVAPLLEAEQQEPMQLVEVEELVGMMIEVKDGTLLMEHMCYLYFATLTGFLIRLIHLNLLTQ
jgi:hypothetical protein